MNKQECVLVKEVLNATSVHVSSLREASNWIVSKRLDDIIEGMEMSISRLTDLLDKRE